MSLKANVIGNLLEFLKRVQVTGLEAYAFVEAHGALQQELVVLQNPQLAAIIASGATGQPALPAQQPAQNTTENLPSPGPGPQG